MGKQYVSARYTSEPSTLHKLGNALQAVGSTAQNLAGLGQQVGMSKEIEDLLSQEMGPIEQDLQKFTTEDQEKLLQQAPDEIPAEVSVSQDTSLPIQKMSQKVESPGQNQLRVQPKGSPEGLPLLEVPNIQGPNQLRTPEDQKQTQMKQQMSSGVVELMEQGVPQKEIQKTLLQMQYLNARMAKIAAKYQKPELAAQLMSKFMSDKLDFYQSMYGADSKMLRELLGYQRFQQGLGAKREMFTEGEKGKTERAKIIRPRAPTPPKPTTPLDKYEALQTDLKTLQQAKDKTYRKTEREALDKQIKDVQAQMFNAAKEAGIPTTQEAEPSVPETEKVYRMTDGSKVYRVRGDKVNQKRQDGWTVIE